MAENRKDNFADEVNDRLSEFFGGAERPSAPAKGNMQPAPQNSEWVDLKAIVLSIEWEISDEIMAQLIAKTDRLMKTNQKNTVVCSLLKLLNSVGRYINVKKADAHPDSIKLLHSIHASLQKIATDGGITEAQSKKILSTEIAKFNDLKKRLATKAEARPPKDITPPQKPAAASPEHGRDRAQSVPAAASQEISEKVKLPKEAVITALDDLKELIRLEFKMLREEIKRLRR